MNDTPDLGQVIANSSSWLRWVLHGLGGGTAVMLGLAGIEAVKIHPELLSALVSQGQGLWFVACVVGMVLFRSEMHSFNEIQTRNVVANERLAASVADLAAKDDSRGQALEAASRYISKSQDELRDVVAEVLRRVKDMDHRDSPHAS